MPFKRAEDNTRRWGTRFDSLVSSSSPSESSGSSPTQPPLSPRDSSENSRHPETEDEQISQDASIFVGSLPSRVDQLELKRVLTDHLSKFAVVKSIKVVRDSRGGVCAFVQCEVRLPNNTGLGICLNEPRTLPQLTPSSILLDL